MVPVVIVIVGAGTLLALIALFALSHRIFDASPKGGSYSAVVWVKGVGSSRDEAESNRDAARQRAMTFLARRGLGDRDIVLLRPLEDFADAAHHRYEADQQIEVRAIRYDKLARLSNAIPVDLDASGNSVSAVYPLPTFMTFAIIVALGYVLLLILAVAALETRDADVSDAPRGMHPFFVGTQTVLLGVLVALTAVYSHLLVAAA